LKLLLVHGANIAQVLPWVPMTSTQAEPTSESLSTTTAIHMRPPKA